MSPGEPGARVSGPERRRACMRADTRAHTRWRPLLRFAVCVRAAFVPFRQITPADGFLSLTRRPMNIPPSRRHRFSSGGSGSVRVSRARVLSFCAAASGRCHGETRHVQGLTRSDERIKRHVHTCQIYRISPVRTAYSSPPPGQADNWGFIQTIYQSIY